MCLRASELISCEWCSLRKLPVLFFQTSEEECVRLRTQLHMSREESGQWYDCSGDRESALANQHLPLLALLLLLLLSPFSSLPSYSHLFCSFYPSTCRLSPLPLPSPVAPPPLYLLPLSLCALYLHMIPFHPPQSLMRSSSC